MRTEALVGNEEALVSKIGKNEDRRLLVPSLLMK
jgi:hypothetical protein